MGQHSKASILEILSTRMQDWYLWFAWHVIRPVLSLHLDVCDALCDLRAPGPAKYGKGCLWRKLELRLTDLLQIPADATESATVTAAACLNTVATHPRAVLTQREAEELCSACCLRHL